MGTRLTSGGNDHAQCLHSAFRTVEGQPAATEPASGRNAGPCSRGGRTTAAEITQRGDQRTAVHPRDRQRVVKRTRVSVRVGHAGSRVIKIKSNIKTYKY